MTAYIIACTPRSGSWLLCDCLRSTGVAGRPGEYAVTDDVATWKGYYGFGTHREYFDRLVTTHSGRHTTGGAPFGLKLMWWQFEGFRRDADGYLGDERDGFGRLRDMVGPVDVVWLRRRDVLRQAVSWSRAQQSGQWSRQAGRPRTSSAEPARYDAGQIRRCLDRIERDNRRWRAALAQARVPALTVWYEDLAEDPDSAIRDVLRYLDALPVEAGTEIVPRLQRQADAETEAWVSRAEAELQLGVRGAGSCPAR